ncbi:MAG: hypothetical protein KC457_33670, partial [Myxococcales bacterium]|nr:hypothetical protein [Myxococcales bacterium]
MLLAACVNNVDENADDDTNSGGMCMLGEQNCECNNGQCLGDLECINGLCVNPNCTPGSEDCPCADGDLCLGDLECSNGICLPPGNDDCAPMAEFHCVDGAVYWFNSCGSQGALKEDCETGT